MIYVMGPGHGGPAAIANAWLEGTYSEVYPDVAQDVDGMKRLFKQFSFPGGIPSHVAPETPGSIHEGGELGYALSHAYGAAFDNKALIVACVIGDGEAETGPLATSWHSNKFLNPARDGAVLPILHLNGAKIAGPTVLDRIPMAELLQLMRGYGYKPHVVSGSDPALMHRAMAKALDASIAEIEGIQAAWRKGKSRASTVTWPMIILRSPKGWTGPKVVDGRRIEGTFRSHQVPFGQVRENPKHLALLQTWLSSYRPRELFEDGGAPVAAIRALAPRGVRRMSANPHANGGVLLRDLRLPDYRKYAVKVGAPGSVDAEATRVQGAFLRDVMKLNAP
jgi:xylulose-5-phosphate/fructose-6-phosphate phosphoketolase